MLSSAAGLLTDQSFLSVFCAAMLTIGIRLGAAEEKYPEGGKPSGTECPAAEADGAVPSL